jgi:hypothetical protein
MEDRLGDGGSRFPSGEFAKDMGDAAARGVAPREGDCEEMEKSEAVGEPRSIIKRPGSCSCCSMFE